ncbi:MAG: amidohydrolase family protein, partial [Candidatus Aminicenantes bacterium]|nr:amidohydrolase family protein [Candidatus Aminicenantes bacterium]
ERKKFDVLILNGRILDGTSNPWAQGDIGIIDDAIAAMGDLSEKSAKITIDANGYFVCPGFIDVHTHCDRGFGIPGTTENINYVTQGVTTVVTGNCGSGSYDIKSLKSAWEKTGIGTNAVVLVGFGTIRASVMGVENRNPTSSELERMISLLQKAMEDGAWGMSTALPYIPDRYARTAEVIAMAKVVGDWDGVYSSHIRDEGAHLLDALNEHIMIGKESEARVHVSHLKAAGTNNWGLMEEAVGLIGKARSEGIEITADMYSYNRASIVPFMMIFNIPDDLEPFTSMNKSIDYYFILKRLGVTIDDFIASRGEPPHDQNRLMKNYAKELETALLDQEKKGEIKKLTLEGAPNKLNWVPIFGWDNFVIIDAPKNPKYNGHVLSEIASGKHMDPFDFAVDLFIEEKDGLTLSVCIMSEKDMVCAVRQDWLMFSSDGGAARYNVGRVHPRYYGSAVRVLNKYVREENIIPLNTAVRKMTSLPAQLFRIKNRGVLRPGCKADIVIFDPDTVRDNATYENPHQLATGIQYVLINGKISIDKGKYNHALNGKVLLRNVND